MFQYAFGRLLAERFGYRLKAECLPMFPGTRGCINGEEVFSPNLSWFGNWPITEDWRPATREHLHTPPAGRLCLRGSFQRFEFFGENRARIRDDWFRIEPRLLRPAHDFAISLESPSDPNEGALALSAERMAPDDDAVLFRDSFLTAAEIRRLAKSVLHRNLFIVIDKLAPDWIQEDLQDLKPTFVSRGEFGNFLFLLGFQKIAISQSVAHWWAAFLSEAREVYFPPCDRGYWMHPGLPVLAHEPPHHGIDLRVDEPRFIYDW
jgi:hypothetical protein